MASRLVVTEFIFLFPYGRPEAHDFCSVPLSSFQTLGKTHKSCILFLLLHLLFIVGFQFMSYRFGACVIPLKVLEFRLFSLPRFIHIGNIIII